MSLNKAHVGIIYSLKSWRCDIEMWYLVTFHRSSNGTNVEFIVCELDVADRYTDLVQDKSPVSVLSPGGDSSDRAG